MIKKLNVRLLAFLWCVAMLTVVSASTTHAQMPAQMIETAIPSDSFLYLKLQNLAACREAIESSAVWQEAAVPIATSPKWQQVNQVMQMLPMLTGTDIRALIDTFLGHQVALTVSPGVEEFNVGIVIGNAAKLQTAEETLSKLVGAVGGMTGGEVPLGSGDYRGVTYWTAPLGTLQLTYGSVDETFLLIGLTPGSFEKMVDTYKAGNASIAESPAYQSVMNNFGKNEVFVFVNVEAVKPIMMLPPFIDSQLADIEALICSWDVLRPGGKLRVYCKLKEPSHGTLISSFQERAKMAAIQGLSGEEDFFLAIAPSSAHIIWAMIIGTARSAVPPTEESLGSFLIPDQTDVLGAVTGGLAISADLSLLDALKQHGLNTSTRSTDDRIEGFDIEFPEADLGLIFNPTSLEKWQALFSGLLERLAANPPEQFDYKGITFNTAFIPGALHYGIVNDLFVLALSEKKCHSMVDTLLAGNPIPTFEKKMEDFPVHPAFLFQLNVGEFLTFIAAAEEIPFLGPEAIAFTEKVGKVFTSLAVGEGAARLELTLSPEEKPINAVARVAPLLFLWE